MPIESEIVRTMQRSRLHERRLSTRVYSSAFHAQTFPGLLAQVVPVAESSHAYEKVRGVSRCVYLVVTLHTQVCGTCIRMRLCVAFVVSLLFHVIATSRCQKRSTAVADVSQLFSKYGHVVIFIQRAECVPLYACQLYAYRGDTNHTLLADISYLTL